MKIPGAINLAKKLMKKEWSRPSFQKACKRIVISNMMLAVSA